jgi:hypothetical protein
MQQFHLLFVAAIIAVAIVLSAVISAVGGRYSVVRLDDSRVLILDRFTGSARSCQYFGCR